MNELATYPTENPREQRVLLHACCGPCSMEPVRLLQERGFEPVIFYANSNIAPACEYERRLDTLRGFAASVGVPVVEGAYCPDAWERTAGTIGDAAKATFGVIADEHAAEFAQMKAAARGESAQGAVAASEAHPFETNPLDYIPSVGNTSTEARAARAARCRACYRLRFEETAAYAAANGFPLLGTTLSVSPYQHTSIIREELERAAAHAGVTPLFEDYRPYYDNATQRSKDAGMYRQNYCGCRFSDEEAAAERAARKAERKMTRVAEKLAAAKERAAALVDGYECGPLEKLPHSDIGRLNASKGEPCPIHESTAALLAAALERCAKSDGAYDITRGPVIRLQNPRNGADPEPVQVRKAMEHVDWRKVNVFRVADQWFAHLADPQAQVDLDCAELQRHEKPGGEPDIATTSAEPNGTMHQA